MGNHYKKVSAAGLLIALGIIYGDIGTSPLYTMQTIINEGGGINKDLVFGAISCIFWTLTLQTTFKYVIITLQADNHGEGGVFSLYALVRRYGKHLVYPAIIGAGTLLADGIITPPISVTSAIEGLSMVKGLEQHIVPGNRLVIEIVLVILLMLFVFQRFGTKMVGASFGPIMFIWFSMLAVLGINQIIHYPQIFAALNPMSGVKLLINHPRGFWLLGAVFLCTTGAEALYSDLGHCGLKNIRITWVFVKSTLVLNYLGQGAWLLLNSNTDLHSVNPFFAVIPYWFLLPGVLIATVATIIASQALISGSFTLISEAISLGFWPRIKTKYPTTVRGQVYIPSINWILFTGCVLVVLYFRTSANMTAAYGFSITVAMLMTTILIYYFLRYIKKYPFWIVGAILTVFVCVETCFFAANAAKLLKRLFFLVFEIGLIGTMYVWYNARKITLQMLKTVSLKKYLPLLKNLSEDDTIPKYSTHLVYLTKSTDNKNIERRIIDSIFSSPPKRAAIYWLINIGRSDDPYLMEYGVEEILDDNVIKVEFRLGFRVQPRLSVMMRKVVEEMMNNKEIDIASRFPSLEEHSVHDVKVVILERFLSYDNEFTGRKAFILSSYFFLLKYARSDSEAYGIDIDKAVFEKVPLIVEPARNVQLKRAFYKIDGKDK